MALVMKTSDKLELNQLLHTLTVELLSDYVTTRGGFALDQHAPRKVSRLMNKSIGDLLPALLKTISDPADEVVLINLQVLAHICDDEVQFLRVLNSLVQLFMEDRPLLETRGALVVRKLCTFPGGPRIYMALASSWTTSRTLEFVSIMVQTLNLILLTAPELTSLRKLLKVSFVPVPRTAARSRRASSSSTRSSAAGSQPCSHFFFFFASGGL